jgi:hypothetical protein
MYVNTLKDGVIALTGKYYVTPSFSVFTYIHSLLIEKNIRVC